MADDSCSKAEERSDEDEKEGSVYFWTSHNDVKLSTTSIFNKRPILKVSMGLSHSSFLTVDRQVFCSGSNSHGQLGLGVREDTHRMKPVLVDSLKDLEISDICCGRLHTAAVSKKNGGIYCWGCSEDGQCALGEPANVNSPTLVQIPTKQSTTETSCIYKHFRYPPFKQVSCGDTHTLGVNVSGEVWSWGSGSQLGLTKIKVTHVPKKIEYLSGYKVLSVAAGAEHSLALVRKNVQTKKRRKDSFKKTVCPKCNSDIYTFVDINDECIISDEHKCPLGCEIDDSSASGGSLSRDLSPDCSNNETFAQFHSNSFDTGANVDNSADSAKNDDNARSRCDPTAKTGKRLENLDRDMKDVVQLRDKKVRNLSIPHKMSFVNVSEARNFLDKQLSCKFVPGSPRLERRPSNVLRQTLDTLWTNVKQPTVMVNNVSAATAKVVSNIRTSMDKYGISLGMADLETVSKSSSSQESLEQPSITCSSPDADEDASSVNTYSLDLSLKDNDDTDVDADLKSDKEGSPLIDPFLNFPKLTDKVGTSYDNSPVESRKQSESRLSEEVIEKMSSDDEVSRTIVAEQPPLVTNTVETSFMTNILEASMSIIQTNKDDVCTTETPQRKVSLKTAMEFKQILAETSREENDSIDLSSFNTEVWSWGTGKHGQLGHGDQLDRPQPCCIKMLGNRHVTKIAAGSKHSLALTATSKTFAWGDNKAGQLGHKDSMSVSPWKVNLPKKSLVWNVEAGPTESVYSCYTSSYQPDVYYTGLKQSSESQGPKKISGLKKLGYIKQLSIGNEFCACILDVSSTSKTAVYHEFAASERNFYNQLEKILCSVIKPLKNIENYSSIEKTSDGTVLTKLFDNFEKVTYMVGLNIDDLTACVQGAILPEKINLVAAHQNVVSLFKEFSHVFGDCLAMGAFEILAKTTGSFLEKLEDVFKDLLDEGKYDRTAMGVSFRRLMQIPLRRLGHYNRLLAKISTRFPKETDIHNLLSKASLLWDALKDAAKKEHTAAETTKIFWDVCPSKYKDSLRCPGRRLLKDSKNSPLTLHNAGRFAMHYFFLFSDIFVHAQYSSHQVLPLATLWTEPLPESDSRKNAICLKSPEERLILLAPSATEKADWLKAINLAVLKVVLNQKGYTALTESSNPTPPLNRNAEHTFYKPGPLKNATYTGSWLLGMPHGGGKISFVDGRNYTGRFKHGSPHGSGTFITPKKGALEVYDGTMKDGKMHGFGSIRYWDSSTYDGYFKNGLRCGHGIFRQGNLKGSDSASIYIGEWSNDKFNGYGVQDNIQKGEKYMGLWLDGNRHGGGVIVTLDGMYYEGNFVNNKLCGYGIMLTDDNSCYEGEFQAGTQLVGKGSLKFSNGLVLDGSFSGTWPDALKFNGNVKMTSSLNEPRGFSHMPDLVPSYFGKIAVPPEQKWSHIIKHCQAMLGCQPSEKPDTTKAWEVVAVMLAAGRKTSREEKETPITPIRLSARSRSHSLSLSDDLEKIPPHNLGILTTEYYQQILQYLGKAFNAPCHPLGKLMGSLVDVFRATYVGIGSHPRLLHHAVLEVKSYILRMYQVVRILFPDLPTDVFPVQIYPEGFEHVETPEDELRLICDEEEIGCEVISATGMLYTFLLPKIYPSLFTLYALYNEKEDERYWERVQRLNKQSDVALLSYLGVDEKFWEVSDDIFSTRSRVSMVREQVYKYAVEYLQQLSTAFCPAEKLETIRNTFNALNDAAKKAISEDFLWCMDELFPVFQYVVVRARIPHLGAEIHFIDDLMDSHLELGELGIMFTTLKASYFQIQNEKILL